MSAVPKTRFVLWGFKQVNDMKYEKTFDLIVELSSFCCHLRFAAFYVMKIHRMDAETTFLNRDIGKNVYMKNPKAVKTSNVVICNLNKSLYSEKWPLDIGTFWYCLFFLQSALWKAITILACTWDEKALVIFLWLNFMLIVFSLLHPI